MVLHAPRGCYAFLLETASHLLRTLQKLKVRVRDVRSKVRECQVRQKSHNVRSDKVDNEWILNVIKSSR